MKIYTRGGDRGETGLFGGGRVPKHHPRIEACGAVDELNAFVGRAVAAVSSEAWATRLRDVQHDLFAVGAHLAAPGTEGTKAASTLPELHEARIAGIEGWIDEIDADLPPLEEFILPGGSRGARELHVCRTVCRRAERDVAALGEGDPSVEFAVRYLNRLSDLFFMLARLENRIAGVEDVHWRKRAPD